MLTDSNKRKPLSCISNTQKKPQTEVLKHCQMKPSQLMPIVENTNLKPNLDENCVRKIFLQNKHPLLAMYNAEVQSDDMSFSQLNELICSEDETNLINFLTEVGIFARFHQCEFCGLQMRKVRQGHIWYWICTRRVNGVKCNRGKFGVRRGTFLDHTHFPIQTVMRIMWNFVYRLSISQCKQYAAISSKSDHTVTEYYADCRSVCNSWIWDAKHTPKLGGYGTIVEMDESFFPGAPKYNRGRRLGTTWEPDDKWVFGLVQRESLNCILKQVPSNRTRKTLLPIIEQHCIEGTIFHSDGWKAYGKLAEHLDVEDCSHFPVNHSSNYVDPETGAHTQTIEGLWSHVKDFLPVRGMKPHDLGSYLGWFMWDRNCRQLKHDKFLHFLRCAAEVRPPSYKVEFQLPRATMSRIAQKTDNEDDDFIS